jgi:hypothetical protein
MERAAEGPPVFVLDAQSLSRHGRLYAGHPRLGCRKKK